MIRRILSLIVLIWLLGLAVFAVTLPGPAKAVRTDGIIVLTGGPGRFQRGLDLLAAGKAKRMLISGVDRSVRRSELDVALQVPPQLSACCIDIEKASVDTVSNARESAAWAKRNRFRTVRLVTTDWHMQRARLELARTMDPKVVIVTDAVASKPGLGVLFREYNKLIARYIVVLVRG